MTLSGYTLLDPWLLLGCVAVAGAAWRRATTRRAALPTAAAHLFDGILFLVPCDLSIHGLEEIDVQVVCQLGEIDRDIGDLFLDLGSVALDARIDLVRSFPEKVLEQFSGLEGNRDRHVLGIVELCPVALVAESSNSLGNFGKRVVCHRQLGVRREGDRNSIQGDRTWEKHQS